MSIKLSVAAALFLAVALAIGSARAHDHEDDPHHGKDDHKVLVKVEGMVYCQDCAYAGTRSLNNAKPLPYAKVSIACKDHWSWASYYKVARADANGYFLQELDGSGYGNGNGNGVARHFDPLRECRVRLLSSPDASCNIPTTVNYGDVNHGIEGAPLRDEGKTFHRQGYDVHVYAAGPLAFKQDHCPPKN